MPETFFGSPASKFWSAGTSDSDFELCILLREEEKFYHVLLVEIGHLIRLMFNGQLEKNYQVVIAAGSHLFPFRTEKLSPFAPMVLQCNAGE